MVVTNTNQWVEWGTNPSWDVARSSTGLSPMPPIECIAFCHTSTNFDQIRILISQIGKQNNPNRIYHTLPTSIVEPAWNRKGAENGLTLPPMLTNSEIWMYWVYSNTNFESFLQKKWLSSLVSLYNKLSNNLCVKNLCSNKNAFLYLFFTKCTDIEDGFSMHWCPNLIIRFGELEMDRITKRNNKATHKVQSCHKVGVCHHWWCHLGYL